MTLTELKNKLDAYTKKLGKEYDFAYIDSDYVIPTIKIDKPTIILAPTIVEEFEWDGRGIILHNNVQIARYGEAIFIANFLPMLDTFTEGDVAYLIGELFEEVDTEKLVEEVEMEAITNEITKLLKFEKERKEKELELEIQRKQSYLDKIAATCNAIDRLRAEQYNDKMFEEITNKLYDTINKIKKHKLTEKVRFENTYINVQTGDVYTEVAGNGRRYYIGRMQILIPLDVTRSTKVLNMNNPRPAYWDDGRRPVAFPHVDTYNTPCLGNVEAQIVQLISDREYYGVYLTMLGYLQSGVDIDDCAGAYIESWDTVDEDGNIIRKGRCGRSPETSLDEDFNIDDHPDDGYQCISCREYFDRDDLTICDDCGTYVCQSCEICVDTEDRYICPICYDSRYSECEDCETVYSNNHLVERNGCFVCEACAQERDEEEENQEDTSDCDDELGF